MYDVTIVTPVYNTQDYLHRCIQSVLEQQGVSLQHIIIDDGSTDNSVSIARFYQKKDSRVLVISKNNAGQGVARNIGIQLANSKYIYFVDSDDYLGSNTLKLLYDFAEENHLDICSPSVPGHYFDKPLEYLPCLPCKSQFIKLEILRRYNIFQPDVRSGQDGVFSHLVLTHAERIGMLKKAEFHYTHAREGSTFAMHLKRHHLVPSFLDEHYRAIIEHYDRFNLWENNSVRILNFVNDESLKNRLNPHFEHLDDSQRRHCFNAIKRLLSKAWKYVTKAERDYISPAVEAIVTLPVDELLGRYADDYIGKDRSIVFKTENIYTDESVICKYKNLKLKPSIESLEEKNKGSSCDSDIINKIVVLDGKLDLAINTINNSTLQITSSINNSISNLCYGNSDIVISLTTLPHRLGLVHLAIESILSQTMLPSKVVLWLSDDFDLEAAMTGQLRGLLDRGLEIRQVQDVGPHTKLLYALKEFGDKNIITVDDDIVYPNNMIQYLWGQHEKFPNSVVCNWARELSFNAAGVVNGVRKGRLLTPPTLELDIEQAESFSVTPSLLTFPYGTSGVLYPPGSLSSTVFDVQLFQNLCPKEDDIWFKAMALMNGTTAVQTNIGISPRHHCITGSQSIALRHDNHGLDQNEEQMRKVFNHFDLYPAFDL